MYKKCRRDVWRFLTVLVVLLPFILGSRVAASSTLYDVATDYVAENNWDMALYAFDRLRTDTHDPKELVLANLWTIAILKGLGDSELMIGRLLGDATEEAIGDDKGRLLDKAIELYEAGLATARRIVPLVALLLSDPPPRRLTITFPKKYSFPSDSDLDGFRAKLRVGLYPGDSAIERELRAARAACVAGVLGDWSGTEWMLTKLVEGYCFFDIDIVKVYADFGRYFEGSEDADEAQLATRCLERVLELTENEQYCKERLEALKLLGR